MDPLSAKIFTTPSPVDLSRSGMTAAKDLESQPQDGFQKAESQITLPRKPSFEVSSSLTAKEALSMMGTFDSFTQSAIATMSGPAAGSITGTIAKWLITDKHERHLGSMVAKQVEKENKISRDKKMNARLQKIGREIESHTQRPGLRYSFKVIEDDTVNAFACPGGKIYVHSGLMKRMKKNSHLAFVVGHEMGHVENRDSIDRMGYNLTFAILQQVTGTDESRLGKLLSVAVDKMYDFRVSQKQEYAADRRGMEHMKSLGYDPREAAGALRRLQAEGEADPGILERLFSTHPPIEERAKMVEKIADEVIAS